MIKFLVTAVIVLICLFLMAHGLPDDLGHHPAAALSVSPALRPQGPGPVEEAQKEKASPGGTSGV